MFCVLEVAIFRICKLDTIRPYGQVWATYVLYFRCLFEALRMYLWHVNMLFICEALGASTRLFAFIFTCSSVMFRGFFVLCTYRLGASWKNW